MHKAWDDMAEAARHAGGAVVELDELMRALSVQDDAERGIALAALKQQALDVARDLALGSTGSRDEALGRLIDRMKADPGVLVLLPSKDTSDQTSIAMHPPAMLDSFDVERRIAIHNMHIDPQFMRALDAMTNASVTPLPFDALDLERLRPAPPNEPRWLDRHTHGRAARRRGRKVPR